MKIRIKKPAVVKPDQDDTFIYAKFDRTTPKQFRFRIDKNKYGFTGSIYLPKETLKGRTPPERLKLRIVFDRD